MSKFHSSLFRATSEPGESGHWLHEDAWRSGCGEQPLRGLSHPVSINLQVSVCFRRFGELSFPSSLQATVLPPPMGWFIQPGVGEAKVLSLRPLHFWILPISGPPRVFLLWPFSSSRFTNASSPLWQGRVWRICRCHLRRLYFVGEEREDYLDVVSSLVDNLPSKCRGEAGSGILLRYRVTPDNDALHSPVKIHPNIKNK